MARKSAQQVIEQSLELRKEMSRLIEQGLTETEALKKVLPEDKNRLTKLKLWEKHKLWPLQEGDLTKPVVKPIAPTVTPKINLSEFPPETVELFNKTLIEFSKTLQNKQNEPKYRPSFKGKRRQTSIRMPILMEKAAMDKAKECGDSKLTGGTIGGLVDLLLWRYLDSDEKFLGGTDDE